MTRRPEARAGMALILTLAAIVLAGGLALLLQARAGARARAEQAELVGEQLRVAAAEAAREALWTLAADEDLRIDHLGEDWALPREAILDDGISTWAVVEDAGRFFNWNNLAASNRATRTSQDILLDLMTFCGDFSPVVRVDALADFVDADEEGAYEAPFYQAAEPPFQPPNRILWAPAELLDVHEFSRDLFRRRSKVRTDDLFGGDLAAATAVVPAVVDSPIPVNVNTASREVLMGLVGLEHETAVRTVLALREVEPFESLAVIFMANPDLAAALEGSVGTSSSFFRVRAHAETETRRREVTAWVERSKTGDIRILQWFEEEG